MQLIAERLDRISPSQTIAIATKARALKAQGRDIISLSAGEPDFDTPQNVKDAAIRAIQAGDTKYTDVAGTKALRQAVADKFKRDSGLDYTTDEIIISTGGKQVIYNAMVATVQAGDEVIIPSAVLGELPRYRGARRRHAGVRAVRPEQRVQDAGRGFGGRDHPADQVVHAEQPVQPNRRGLLGRGAASDLRRAAAPP